MSKKKRKKSDAPKLRQKPVSLERVGTYSITEVFKFIKEAEELYNQGLSIKFGSFNNYMIKPFSHRYKCFMNSGTKCVKCGLEATHFGLEKFPESKSYHLNLYALTETEEILFTKDHIYPLSLGGKNVVENYQTMCCKCNEAKGSEINEDIIQLSKRTNICKQKNKA